MCTWGTWQEDGGLSKQGHKRTKIRSGEIVIAKVYSQERRRGRERNAQKRRKRAAMEAKTGKQHGKHRKKEKGGTKPQRDQSMKKKAPDEENY